jgi:hypothetical protein
MSPAGIADADRALADSPFALSVLLREASWKLVFARTVKFVGLTSLV